MKVILDEGVPKALRSVLPGQDVHSVDDLGWKGVKNGSLLALVESVAAQAFITADKNMERQQTFSGRTFATLVLSTNSWPLLRDHGQVISAALNSAQSGTVTPVECGRFVPRRFRQR